MQLKQIKPAICITCGQQKYKVLYKCQECKNLFCGEHKNHNCLNSQVVQQDTTYTFRCRCCSAELANIFHVVKKNGAPDAFCDKCYVSSHHLEIPSICPHKKSLVAFLRALDATHLTQAEADKIKKYVDQRVRS